MPWTNAQQQSMLPPQTPMTDRAGRHTKDARFWHLAIWKRTGGGTGIVPQVSPNLTATGTKASDALALLHDWNIFATVPAGSGAHLPILSLGQDVQVFNSDPANALLLYPGTQAIDALGVGVPYSLPAGKTRTFQATAMGVLYSTGN